MTMNKLRLYMSLLELTNSAAEELNFCDLTSADKDILLHIWNSTKEGEHLYCASHDEFLTASKDISKSQFYKSIKKLLDEGILKKVGSERSATYQLTVAG